MSIQKLKDQIQDVGAAHAIISLDPKVLTPRESATVSDDGQISRKAPSIDSEILSELSSHFQLGWAELRESMSIDLEELASVTPTIRRLLSGDQSQQSSHMIHFPHLGIVYGAVNREGLQVLEIHHAVDNIQHASNELSPIQPDSTEASDDEE